MEARSILLPRIPESPLIVAKLPGRPLSVEFLAAQLNIISRSDLLVAMKLLCSLRKAFPMPFLMMQVF